MYSSPDITPVTAFVDWNSQIHAARFPKEMSPIVVAQKTLDYVARAIGRSLNSVRPTLRFDVTLRLYHGWHKGFEPTARRKAVVYAAAGADFLLLSNQPNVSIRRVVEFGDNLISASSERLHYKLSCHLPNTLRKGLKHPFQDEEKMVDTAIASEVVDLSHRDPDRWLVVLGDDDDLVPPVYVAEGVRGRRGGRVLLLRTRPQTPFLKLQDLLG